MAKFMILGSFCLVLMAASRTLGQDCGEQHLYPNNPAQKLQDAEIVLYGRDVSPPAACSGAPETCARHQIQFQVDCVLKSGGVTIVSEITIGRYKNTTDRCDVNTFGNVQRNSMIVMVRYNKTTGMYDWDSLPRQTAYFLVSAEQVKATAQGACGLTSWTAPRGGANHCPTNISGSDFPHCGPGCRAPWFRVGDFCYKVDKEGGVGRTASLESCENVAAELASFPSQEDWLPVKEVLGQNPTGKWWVGGETDGENITHTSPDDMETVTTYADWKTVQGTGSYIFADSQGWERTDAIFEKYGKICQRAPVKHYPLLPKLEKGRGLELSFTVPSLHLYFCCNPAYYSSKTTTLTETNRNDIVQPGYLRVLPVVSIKTATPEEYFTLTMADISGHDILRGTTTTPYIHWMVTNLRVGSSGELDMSSAQTLFAYEPVKPISRDHEPYVVFLAKQQRKLDEIEDINAEMMKYSEGLCIRCSFHLRVYERVNALTPVDALWFRAAVDGWTARERVMVDGTSKPSEVCPRVWENVVFSGENAICQWEPSPSSAGDPRPGTLLLSLAILTTLIALTV